MRAGWILIGCVGLAACGSVEHEGLHAMAAVRASGDNAAAGEVTFIERSNGRVLVVANLSGLKPYSEHGFHIHETGDCSARDGASAGGHFNPAKVSHGHLSVGGRHAGDLPNLRTDARGHASTSIEIKGLSVAPGPTSIVGRSIVVHALPDDYRSDPNGKAGPAIGCGVIEKA